MATLHSLIFSTSPCRCFNLLVTDERKYHQEALLEVAEPALHMLKAQLERRANKPLSKAESAQKRGWIINRHKVAKHCDYYIQNGCFSFKRNETAIKWEADHDGMYVVRTNKPKEMLSVEQVVR